MRQITIVLVGLLAFAGVSSAETYYVNNLNGRDFNDGLVAIPVNSISGPLKTIRRALELVNSGDTIILANTGTPYYESLSFVGTRRGGVKSFPLTLIGNGAILSGLRGLPKDSWQKAGEGLWRVSFTRKGSYALLRDGLLMKEHRADDPATILDSLPEGQWCAHRGSVYYRQEGVIDPSLERIDYAADEMGVTFYQTDHVRIQDLTIQHFRVDGLNAHNMSRGIILDNVISRENGRAGLAIGGTSAVQTIGGRFEANGRHAVLITGKGSLEADGSEFDVEPDVGG